MEAFSKFYRHIDEAQVLEDAKAEATLKVDFYGKAKFLENNSEGSMVGLLVKNAPIIEALQDLEILSSFFQFGIEDQSRLIFVLLVSLDYTFLVQYDLTAFPALRAAYNDNRFHVIFQ